ncbi:MAG: hypothetical protein RBU21_09970 [FCB group bacterium]|jgi:DNA-directed RNA polymerase specialized sigma24 family protein|nr:hypothetical protein [FCB group bacterium]
MQAIKSAIGRFLQRDDRELVRRVLGGNREEYLLLVRRHFLSVYAHAYARLGARAEAAGVTREAFLEAYRRLDSLALSETFEDRLRAVTRELCKHPPSRAAADDSDNHRRIRQAFLALGEPARHAVLLRCAAGRPLAEIARLCGLSQGETRSLLAAAEARLGNESLKGIVAAVLPALTVEDVARDALSEPIAWRAPEPHAPAARGRLRWAAAGLLALAAGCYFAAHLLPSETIPGAPPSPVALVPAPAAPAPAPLPASVPAAEPAEEEEAGAVEGLVVDALTEVPVTEFEVAHPKARDAHGKPVFVKTADLDGRFHLGGLTPGKANILVRAAGYANAVTEATVPEPPKDPVQVLVRLERARAVEGSVVDATGRPVPDVAIFVGQIPFPFLEGLEAGRSDAQGHFRAEGVPSRPVAICAWHPDYATASMPAIEGGELRFRLAPAARLEGLISAAGEPLANAEVRVEPKEGDAPAVSSFADAEGRFALTGLPEGPLAFTANWLNTRHAARSVDTKAGETARIEIDFPPATTRIEGRVTQHGVLVQYAELEVEVTGSSGEVFTTIAKTGDEGWYRTEPVPPGKARLFTMAVTADSRMRRKVVETDVAGSKAVRQDVDFKETARLEGELAGLEKGEHARVYVLWSPPEREPMNFHQLEALTRKAVARQFLRRNGPLRIDSLEPGRYTLYAVALREETLEDFARGRSASAEVTVDRKGGTQPARLEFK